MVHENHAICIHSSPHLQAQNSFKAPNSNYKQKIHVVNHLACTDDFLSLPRQCFVFVNT